MRIAAKKRSLLALILGIILCLVSVYFIYHEYDTLKNGEKTQGTVMYYEPHQTSSRETMVLSYPTTKGVVTLRTSYLFSLYQVSDKIPVYHKGIKTSIPVVFNGFWISLALVFLLSVFLILWGRKWTLRRSRIIRTNITQLKRHGRRVHAKYLYKEELPQIIDGHPGIVLILKEEKGETLFRTQPIFSEFSIRWLEDHVFDVYLSQKNKQDYYIDLEKHYGAHEKYKR